MEDLCRRYRETLGEVEIPRELVEHGRSCEACGDFRRKHDALLTALPAWKNPEFTDDFTLSVMSRIAENPSKKRRFWRLMRDLLSFRLPVPLPIGAAAVALLICSTSLNVLLWNRDQTKEQERGLQHRVTQLGSHAPAVVNTSQTDLGVPPEWLGSGAFLVIPLGISRDFPYAAWNREPDLSTKSTDEEEKI